jgi:hypothetical protein
LELKKRRYLTESTRRVEDQKSLVVKAKVCPSAGCREAVEFYLSSSIA